MENIPGYKIDRIISIVGLGIVAFLYLKMQPYPEEARIMPGALLIAAGILFVILGFQAFVVKQNKARSFAGVPGLKLALVVVSTTIYYVFIIKLGFYLSSWIFFMVTTTWINPKKSRKDRIFSWIWGTLFVLFLYLIFEMFLRVPLPRGAFI